MNQTFTAEILEVNGIKKLKMSSSDYFQTRIQKLPLGKYTVTVSDTKKRRSNSANAFYWVYLTLLEEETGNDKMELHEYFKRKHLQPRNIKVMGKEITIPGSTKTLKSYEMSEYIKKIEVETGILAPDPADCGYYVDKGEIQKPADIDYPIQSNKTAF
jgi:hypothetical protein